MSDDKTKWLQTEHLFEPARHPDWDPTGGPNYCDKCGMEQNYYQHILAATDTPRAREAISVPGERAAYQRGLAQGRQEGFVEGRAHEAVKQAEDRAKLLQRSGILQPKGSGSDGN